MSVSLFCVSFLLPILSLSSSSQFFSVFNFYLSIAGGTVVQADLTLRYTRVLLGMYSNQPTTRGQNSSVGSVLGSLSCLMSVLWIQPFSELLVEDFSLGVNMGSDSIPPKLFQVRV